MKLLILPLSFLIAAVAALADANDPYRTFTNEQGRTLRAVVVRTGPEEVWIRRDDGQTFRVPRKTFIKKDRKYIAKWERNQALNAPNALEFSARRFSEGHREVSMTATRRNTSERFGYIITLANNSPFDLKDLDIEYRCFVWTAEELKQSGQNRTLSSSPGRIKLEILPSRGSAELQTNAVTLRSTKLLPNAYNPTTNRRSANDDLRGIWIKIWQDGELVAEFSSPARLKETENW